MLAIGLTGGIGSGKSTVARMFLAHGITVIDTDEISHALTARNGDAIPLLYQAFGAGIFKPDGMLDRDRLRSLMLADLDAKARLEAIIHPMIRDVVSRQLAGAHGAYVLIVIPLLFESNGYKNMLDRVLVVDCAEDAQIARVQARNGWAREEIVAIMARQADRITRLKHADDVIDNGGDETNLMVQVGALHRKYLALAGQHHD